MNIKEYLLLDEMKRLNRLNNNLEKAINKRIVVNNEPEQNIVSNVLAMCEIAKIVY